MHAGGYPDPSHAGMGSAESVDPLRVGQLTSTVIFLDIESSIFVLLWVEWGHLLDGIMQPILLCNSSRWNEKMKELTGA